MPWIYVFAPSRDDPLWQHWLFRYTFTAPHNVGNSRSRLSWQYKHITRFDIPYVARVVRMTRFTALGLYLTTLLTISNSQLSERKKNNSLSQSLWRIKTLSILRDIPRAGLLPTFALNYSFSKSTCTLLSPYPSQHTTAILVDYKNALDIPRRSPRHRGYFYPSLCRSTHTCQNSPTFRGTIFFSLERMLRAILTYTRCRPETSSASYNNDPQMMTS